MTHPLVYADFNNLDDGNRLRLTSNGTRLDLAQLGIELQSGMVFTFYMDDADDQGGSDNILVDGTVDYDSANGCWVAQVDWSKVRHVSDENKVHANGTLGQSLASRKSDSFV